MTEDWIANPFFTAVDAVENAVSDAVQNIPKPTSRPPTVYRTTSPDKEPVMASHDTRGTLRFMTHNVQNYPNLPRSSVLAIGRKLSGTAGIIGLQEIGERQDHADIAKGLGPNYILTHPGDSNPFAIDGRYWQIVSTLHRDLWMVKSFHTLGWGNLTLNGVHLKSKNTDIPPFWVLNTHMAVGGYGPRAKTKNPTTWEKRRHEWNAEADHIKTVVKSLDAAVFFMGDLNNREAKAGQFGLTKWLRDDAIDKIGYADRAGVSCRKIRNIGFGDASDHDARGVVVDFGKD